MNESIRDFVNYNDFLANNFDSWGNDIDFLMKDLNKVARALKVKVDSLIFYVDYNDVFWTVDDIADVVSYITEDYSLYQLEIDNTRFAYGDNIWIFRSETEADYVIDMVEDYARSMNEGFAIFEGIVYENDDIKRAKEKWEELDLDVDFDMALERWNKESKMAEKGWFEKPVYSIAAWNDMIQMFTETDIPEIEEPKEDKLEMPEPDEEISSEQESTVDFNDEIGAMAPEEGADIAGEDSGDLE